MNILLVDDDILAIEGIALNLDWRALGIDEYYLAHSALQAKEIFARKDINILLSDIEMPKGSGLELVEWVNENKRNVVCVFLTSHANFDYANTALRLGGIDYLLKPAPYQALGEAICKAVARVRQLHLQQADTEQAAFWNESKLLIAERFWYDIACGTLPEDGAVIAEQAVRRHVDYTGCAVRPVLFELSHSTDEKWDHSLLEVALFNILREVLAYESIPPIILHMENNNYLALVSQCLDTGRLCGICTETVDICESLFSMPIHCYYGSPVLPEALHNAVGGLLSARFGGGSQQPCIGCIQSKKAQQLPPDISTWFEGLARGKYDEVMRDIKTTLTSSPLTRSQLTQIYQGFIWGIYPLLDHHGASEQSLLAEDPAIHPVLQDVSNVQSLLQWIEHVVLRLAESGAGEKDDVLAKVQHYISEHLADDLNRADIATAVFLSPDHLSHMFKAKTGSSLMDYIIDQRMERAKKLLTTTNLPIHRIATEVGYNNIPYFSKLFRRWTGMTPQKFRKQYE